MSGLFGALEIRMPTEKLWPNGTRIGLRIFAGLAIASVVAITGVVFGHVVQPSHAVAQERMDHFSDMQRDQSAAILSIDGTLGEFAVQLGIQTAILQSIDRRLDALEP